MAEAAPPLSPEDLATCKAILNDALAERAEIDSLLVQTMSLSIEVDHRINVARAWTLLAAALFGATLFLLFLPP